MFLRVYQLGNLLAMPLDDNRERGVVRRMAKESPIKSKVEHRVEGREPRDECDSRSAKATSALGRGEAEQVREDKLAGQTSGRIESRGATAGHGSQKSDSQESRGCHGRSVSQLEEDLDPPWTCTPMYYHLTGIAK